MIRSIESPSSVELVSSISREHWYDVGPLAGLSVVRLYHNGIAIADLHMEDGLVRVNVYASLKLENPRER